MTTPDEDREGIGRNGKIRCEDIQAVLFDYMTRELGQSRADLVREHLRKCEDCQAEGREIQATLDALYGASREEAGMPERLSEDRRRRIIRALAHPVIHWIERHHMLVSLVVAAVVIAVVLGVLRRTRLWDDDRPVGPPVTIGGPGMPGGTNAPPAEAADPGRREP